MRYIPTAAKFFILVLHPMTSKCIYIVTITALLPLPRVLKLETEDAQLKPYLVQESDN